MKALRFGVMLVGSVLPALALRGHQTLRAQPWHTRVATSARQLALATATADGPAAEVRVDDSEVELKSTFLQKMRSRGYLYQCSNIAELDALMSKEVVPAYLGFDATAKSLHVGSLVQIMILRHLQKAGHKPVVLVGGGTTKIGDPSGRDETRQLLTQEAIDENIAGISRVFERFITFGDGPTDAIIVNNDAWLSQLQFVDFLREYGKHFTINRMLNFESVKQRLEREQPLTFLEFNYMIFQAYDFLELSRRHGCRLQMGGSDQWGNIINGVELGRRVDDTQLFAMTAPLLTTSDGKKMGKSMGGAVWLNEDLLSPYDYWQYWRNTADADVIRFLRLFTELPDDRIDELAKLKGQAINEAKEVLADETTRMLHGQECLSPIKETAKQLFSAEGGGTSDDATLPTVELPAAELGDGVPVVDLFLKLEFAKSKSEVRRLIKGGGARINDEKVADEGLVITEGDFAEGKVKVSSGKKKHGIVKLS